MGRDKWSSRSWKGKRLEDWRQDGMGEKHVNKHRSGHRVKSFYVSSSCPPENMQYRRGTKQPREQNDLTSFEVI